MDNTENKRFKADLMLEVPQQAEKQALPHHRLPHQTPVSRTSSRRAPFQG
jgi:hypothetical protein